MEQRAQLLELDRAAGDAVQKDDHPLGLLTVVEEKRPTGGIDIRISELAGLEGLEAVAGLGERAQAIQGSAAAWGRCRHPTRKVRRQRRSGRRKLSRPGLTVDRRFGRMD
jgi:hypothetical protein